MAVAVSHVLIGVGKFLHAADEVAAREILLGVAEIFARHAEVLSGGAKVTMVVVAMVVVMTMVMVVAMVMVVTMVVTMVVVVVEQITEETSDETSHERQTEHAYSP